MFKYRHIKPSLHASRSHFKKNPKSACEICNNFQLKSKYPLSKLLQPDYNDNFQFPTQSQKSYTLTLILWGALSLVLLVQNNLPFELDRNNTLQTAPENVKLFVKPF